MDRIREYMGLCDIQVGQGKPAAVRGGWDEYTKYTNEYTDVPSSEDSSPEDQITGGYSPADTPVVIIPAEDKKVMIA